MEEEKAIVRNKRVKINHNQPFGKVLEQYMKRDRWSGAQLGDKVGCTRNHISEIVNGHCYPSYTLGNKIADVFGCELGWRKTPPVPKSAKRKKGAALTVGASEPVLKEVEAPSDEK